MRSAGPRQQPEHRTDRAPDQHVEQPELRQLAQRVAVDYLLSDYGDDIPGLLGAFTTERFRVNAGERELYRDFSGEWRRWDRDTMTWV